MRVVDRLLQKVDRRAATGCWEFTGGRDRDGYGMFWLDGRTVRAHRASYELHVGPIPQGLTLDHLCRNTACVNPAHLEPTTMRENTLRGTSPVAVNASKTRCQAGHLFTRENTFRNGTHRRCRTCYRKWKRAYRAARAAPC